MARRRIESVSVSFHYLSQVESPDSGEEVPFTRADFDGIVDKLSKLAAKAPSGELLTKEQKAELQSRDSVLFFDFEKIDKNTMFGRYKNPYWGHEYENTERGNIPADSINLRPFCFILYLSENGRIYIGTQYLGGYGGYTGLCASIISLMPKGQKVKSNSIRSDMTYLENAVPKKIFVTIAKSGSSIEDPNVFKRSTTLAFAAEGRGDNFSRSARDRILSLIGFDRKTIKEKISDQLKSSGIMSVSDDNIRECSILVSQNGKDSMIYMLGDGGFATKYPLSVSIGPGGHPDRDEAKTKMIELLSERVIEFHEES